MKQVDVEEAAERLEDLIEEAAAGSPFIITVAGEPLVRVEPVEAEDTGETR